MIISALPDPAKSSEGNNSGPLNNSVICSYTKEKYHYPVHSTPYLFATNFLNKGEYRLNDRPIRISEKYFYFLNPGDRLAISFNESLPLKTLLVLFNADFVNNAFYSLTRPGKELLERPFDSSSFEPAIPSIPFRLNAAILELISQLTQTGVSQCELDDHLFDLIKAFAGINENSACEMNKINVTKKSTKEELYRRLFLAREFMEDNYTEVLTIDEIAKEACLSKFHFLANFKELYGVTPHQYLMNLKLRKAYDLLKKQQCSVTEVCYKIGFESTASFSSLFKRQYGISPSIVLKEYKIPNFQ